jgi:hypothetical protein
MPGEAMKGSGAPDKILTYRYVKPWVHWFPNEKDPLTDTFRIARGLRGYAHRARSRTTSGKETWQSLTRPQPLSGLGGFLEPWAPDLQHFQAQPLAPA